MRKIVVFLSAIFFSFATQAVADSTDMKSYMQELQNLSRLKASGELSADEYNTRREELKTRYLKTSEAEKKPVSPKRSDSENKPTPKNETVKPDLVSGNQASQHQAKQPGNEIQKVIDATVQIEIFDKAGSKRGSGSGFIVDPTGIIVTNNHVLNNAASVLIRLANGDTYKDLMVRDFDEVKDLAIIKISGFDLPTVKLGNSSSLKGGEKILTCGFSLGEYANTVSDGLISGVRQNEKGYRYLQISAPISPGNSGGPVISETGEVIGVSTATNLEGQNLNFAVPINYVLGMLENDKKMTLTQYSSVCGQTMEHMIIDAKRSDEQLAHPDADISKRIVIVPFSGFCQFMPNVGTEILAALILRLKANYKDEKLFVVDHQTVMKNLQESMGDQYDSMLATFDADKAREFAIKFRANTVIFGKVNHFAIDTSPVFVPFVGWMPQSLAVMNVDYSIFKLDQNKIINEGQVRRKQDGLSPADAVLRIANVIVGNLLKKWPTFASSNKHGEKPIQVMLDGSGQPKVELKVN